MHPLPKDLGDILRRYPKVLVPEMNTGQLTKLIRAEYLVDAQVFSKVQGQPIFAEELEEEIIRRLA
jgi:2-oxoglutarate ferredoxin oxidoreductase subunit alpha